MELIPQPFKDLQTMIKNTCNLVIAWIGEAGGAYICGRNLVTDRFMFSFWFLDQLGTTSLYDTKTYCRRTLIGGNYGLLNTTTFILNPDYYSALLWHRLMGKNVLSTNSSAIKKLSTYAHCSKNSLCALPRRLQHNLISKLLGKAFYRASISFKENIS